MGIFTSAIFFKRDKVRSRSLLGFTAVISVLLSIMAGYGLMFVCAVPFTSMTQILPFVFFGVGLDDAFIITGSFFRLDPNSKDAVARVRDMIDDIGMSIFLTTLTSSLAFGLGCISSVPAIFWLCVYAVPTMVFILLFQLTFFISCMVLDDRRIQKGNRDCFRCCSRTKADNEAVQEESIADRFMGWYAEKLLQPWVKVFVILAFIGIAAACAVSTSSLEQSFEFTDVLPSDSYITDFFDAFNAYSVRSSVVPFAYFRYVDQSNEAIQDEMLQYVEDLVSIDAIVDPPEQFWLQDFRSFAENSTDTDFTAQLDAFLADPVFKELYSDHIVRDDSGIITASRVLIHMDNVDIEEVTEQVDALEDQRAVSEAAQVNQGHTDDLRFFTCKHHRNVLVCFTWSFFCATLTLTLSL
jgi:predicted RND superfamily exporter protein